MLRPQPRGFRSERSGVVSAVVGTARTVKPDVDKRSDGDLWSLGARPIVQAERDAVPVEQV